MSRNARLWATLSAPAVLTALAVLTAPALLAACQLPMQRESRLAMSSAVSITVYSRHRPDWDTLFGFIAEEAAHFDWRHPEGEVGRINRGEALVPPPEVAAALRVALEAARESGGAFDVTILPLTGLWDFDGGGRLPSPAEIGQARRLVDWRRLAVDAEGRTSLPPGFGLELGGIAAGAVVDLVGGYLDRRGEHDYLIDSSGDILISGLKQGRTPWTVAIRHPRQTQGYLGIVRLGRAGGKTAIATSGDYERFFEKDGVRYHHILDPATGYPAQGLASVTVIAPTCVEVDVLSTTVFVLGREKGLALLERWPGAEGLLIGEQNGRLEAWATPGFPLRPEELKL